MHQRPILQGMMLQEADYLFLERAKALAQCADAATAPNPHVGAVAVHNGRILGEGYHARAGGPHAEVVALQKVSAKELLLESTLYVTLEPCNHYGKTPPCTERILQDGLGRIVVGCLDPNPKVAGAGVARLREAGVAVFVAEDPAPFQALIRPFWVNQTVHRPYVTLKWAQTSDGKLGRQPGERLQITAPATDRWMHRLRQQHAGILVGHGTLRADNPQLSNRHQPGWQPTPIVLAPTRLPHPDHRMFQGGKRPIVVTNAQVPAGYPADVLPAPRQAAGLDIPLMLNSLYHEAGIYSLLVEGGGQVLRAFLAADAYDELVIAVGRTPAPTAEVSAPSWPRVPFALVDGPPDAVYRYQRPLPKAERP